MPHAAAESASQTATQDEAAIMHRRGIVTPDAGGDKHEADPRDRGEEGRLVANSLLDLPFGYNDWDGCDVWDGMPRPGTRTREAESDHAINWQVVVNREDSARAYGWSQSTRFWTRD